MGFTCGDFEFNGTYVDKALPGAFAYSCAALTYLTLLHFKTWSYDKLPAEGSGGNGDVIIFMPKF